MNESRRTQDAQRDGKRGYRAKQRSQNRRNARKAKAQIQGRGR